MPHRTRLTDTQELPPPRSPEDGGVAAATLLGFQAGEERWLTPLTDAGEIVSTPPLARAPLTCPWFAGLANVRGTLYAVSDFALFRGGEATPHNSHARLLLIGARHGVNAALLVSRLIGLRKPEALHANVPTVDAPVWAAQSFRDNDGHDWRCLDVAGLLADPRFLEIGA
ncbi:chemotaxis protein CheW [Rhodocyclus tenuis]|uniref:Chemotaxis protein CheW n=1 Tax=Rhodocyclus gracilis TaxID=2929842 RepID=A0ABX0WKQ1_9RHOO|nr:chemotaxis protein CheW [Rhodocyclus gracilis]NJA89362.1 chemotaxis protein CheW [Rhodocyclus gracilis]